MGDYKLEDILQDNGLSYMVRKMDGMYPLTQKDKDIKKKFVLQYFGKYKKIN